MKFAVIPDIHLKRTDSLGIIGSDGINTRLRDKLNAIKFCIGYAIEKECEYIVFLGDIFETINPGEKLRRMFWQELLPAIEKGLQIRIILGNHDMTGSSYNLSSDQLISNPNIKIYHESSVETISGGIKINYVPYSENPEFDAKADIVFGHIEIEGAVMGVDNRNMVAATKKSQVPGKFRCFGHIHKFQEFSPGFGYLGSITQCNFGEAQEKKFMCCCEVSDTIKWKYIEIPQRPMIVTEIREDDKDNIYISEKIPDELNTDGAMLKFNFTGTREWLQSINKKSFVNRFKNAIKVDINTNKVDSDSQEVIDNSMGMEERLRNYATSKKKKTYVDSGIEIMKEAKEIDL